MAGDVGASSASGTTSTSIVSNKLPTMLETTRGYQLEMLHSSLEKNIIIALDTGSGKTLIAILRIKHEMEIENTKVCWFLAPTVTLCKQQKSVFEKYLPVSIGIISGESDPDQWKDRTLWAKVLETHRVIVSTPQVLLDALRHGYVVLGRDISLLIFDEAHHAVGNDPYNRIMAEFYFNTPPRQAAVHHGFVRPMVLGLTASPIFGGDPVRAFMVIEKNLDSTICTPIENREELSRFVQRPEFRHYLYQPPNSTNTYFSTNLATLHAIVSQLDITKDPFVASLQRQRDSTQRYTHEWRKLDQKLSDTIQTETSFTQKGLRDFARAACDIAQDLGSWAADWYVWSVVEKSIFLLDPLKKLLPNWKDSEKAYLLKFLKALVLIPPSTHPDDLIDGLSMKAKTLVWCLLNEKRENKERDEEFSGIIFVQRRDMVITLAEVLRLHPDTSPDHMFRVGSLVGASDSGYRHSFLDITRYMLNQSQDQTLSDFKEGKLNLIVSTSVAEEGIDIQACGSVLRWDPPMNMASFAQSRGRARRKKSTFTLLVQEGSKEVESLTKWQQLERKMVDLYRDPYREVKLKKLVEEEEEALRALEDDDDEEQLEFKVEATGATLTLHSAVSHIAHFCASMPRATHVTNVPIYLLDPPDHPTEWYDLPHLARVATSKRPYEGPWGATLVLPRSLPWELREFWVDMKFSTKVKAYRQVAFKAYKALYEAGMLNDNLMPLDGGLKNDGDNEETFKEEIAKRMDMEGVTDLQINPWNRQGEDESWYQSELRVDGLPPLRLFTRVEILTPEFQVQGLLLHRPDLPPVRATLHPQGRLPDDQVQDVIRKAEEYTRMLFWSLNGSRTEWDRVDFSYLFLPYDHTIGDHGEQKVKWEVRRTWRASLPDLNPPTNESNPLPSHPSQSLLCQARMFGEQYDYPYDITLVRPGFEFDKAHSFVRWRYQDEPLTEIEEMSIREQYEAATKDQEPFGLTDDLVITWPLLQVESMPCRVNSLIPYLPTALDTSTVLLPEFSFVALLSKVDLEYAALLPSVLRHFTIGLTAESLGRNVLSREQARGGITYSQGLSAQPDLHASTELSPPLSSIPPPLLAAALLTPAASEQSKHLHLESLGDAALKLLVSFQLFAEYPFWHEGYLTREKDRLTSTGNLAKDGVRTELYRWIIRDRLLSHEWTPSYLAEASPESPADEAEAAPKDIPGVPKPPSSNPRKKRKKRPSAPANDDPITDTPPPQRPPPEAFARRRTQKKKKSKKSVVEQELSMKMVASVLEALVGASYLFGGFDLAAKCGSFFGLGMRWEPAQTRFESIIRRLRVSSQPLPSRNPHPSYPTPVGSIPDNLLPSQLKHVEDMLGYTFNHKALLVEALTHASYQQTAQGPPSGDSSATTTTAPPNPTPTSLYNTSSYERLQFFGNALLDMIFVDTLFSAPNKNYSPAHIQQRKQALVNPNFLAYVCLKTNVEVEKSMPNARSENGVAGRTYRSTYSRRGPSSISLQTTTQTIYLFQCLLHSSTRILEDQTETFERFKRLEPSLTSFFEPSSFPTTSSPSSFDPLQPTIFPWVELTSLQAPKLFGDIIQSLLGAIFLDSGSFPLGIENVKRVLDVDGFGILPIVNQIITGDIDVRHPVSRIESWAEDNGKTVKFEYIREQGRIRALVMVDGKEEVRVTGAYHGKLSFEEVKFKAAEAAIEALGLRS